MLHRLAPVFKMLQTGLKKVLDEVKRGDYKILCEEMGSKHTTMLLHIQKYGCSREEIVCRYFILFW
jgi:hypothetical protein